MADKFYLNNRLKYHTASRVANQTGDSLAATFNVDGHIVRDSSVWTSPLSAFPLQSNEINADPIGATQDLVAVFKAGATSVDFWNGGKVWTNTAYPAVKLYEDVPMTPVAASLGQNMNTGKPTGTAYYQAYEILASASDGYSDAGDKNVRVTEWVAPPAIIDPRTGKPVAGYTGLQMLNSTALQKVSSVAGKDINGTTNIAASSDTKWGLGGGHWEFVYMAGILTFEMGVTPQEIAAQSTNGLTLTAFKYDGEYLADGIANIKSDIADLEIIASGKEIEVTDIDLTSTDGKVSVEVAGEVLVVKEGTEEIQPDMTFNGTKTVLTADYGKVESVPAKWTVTYRVIA